MRRHAFLSLALLPVACLPPLEDEVLLSGRVQLDPESAAPAAGAFVRVTDSNKSKRCFVTACDGTFAVHASELRQLVFPLTDVSVEHGVTNRMHGEIRDQRSCSGCHAGGVSLFSRASVVPSELRSASASCAPSDEMRCPEDR